MPHGDAGPRPRNEPLERGAGRGRWLFVDASISGAGGDMWVAALLDLGVPRGVLDEAVAALDLGASLRVGTAERSGIVASTVRVGHGAQEHERTWRAVRSLLRSAALGEGARERALRAFTRLAEAEANVHGVAPDDVHFHEVGAVDSIVDIVCAAVGLDHLGADSIVGSPVPLGHGRVQARHGWLPLPAPATVSCLTGCPTFEGGVEAELVTPTGAALLATSAERFARWPAMRPERTGWGAGSRELDDRPNVLRLVLGEPTATREAVWVVETNVDDMSPELAAYAADALRQAGALDVWTTAVTMKKGRAGTVIAALAAPDDVERLSRVMLRETSSLGVRSHPAQRLTRPRSVVEVATRFGPIAVKIAEGDGLPRHVAPEFESCRAAAERHGVALKEVYAATLAEVR